MRLCDSSRDSDTAAHKDPAQSIAAAPINRRSSRKSDRDSRDSYHEGDDARKFQQFRHSLQDFVDFVLFRAMLHNKKGARQLGVFLSALAMIFVITLKIFSTARPLQTNPSNTLIHTVTLPEFAIIDPTQKRLLSSWTEDDDELWVRPRSDHYHQCVARSQHHHEPGAKTNGYLLVTANGGLNQMRMGICDMVAVARLMNATLVVPVLDKTSFWNDPSDFKDVFDVKYFIRSLRGDVRVVEELPLSLRNIVPFSKAPVSWSNEDFYTKNMTLLLKEHKILHLTHADARLANNGLSDEIQQLRCRANYEALRFTGALRGLADVLIKRMRRTGPFIALHLRYEKDMLAFTGCTHGLSNAEARELTRMRYGVKHWKEKEIDGEEKRKQGACPLTPYEAGLFLKALGYPESTGIYVVAGEIYGDGSMASFKKMFSNVFSHSTLATYEELSAIAMFQNRLSAVDYAVALESDVFVFTHDGNMAKALQGHRRYEGFRKTISPDRQRLIQLTDHYAAGNVSWNEFAAEVRILHETRIGGPTLRTPGPVPKLEDHFFANPFPGCICRSNDA